MATTTASHNHKFQVDEIVTIKASNDCDLCYGKIKKIHDDNVHYDIEQLPSNAIKRGLGNDQIEMVAFIQYAAFIREKGSPPKWPIQLINYAEENGIDNEWIKYVDAKWIIDTKPDITDYNRLPPPILQKPTVSIHSMQQPSRVAGLEHQQSLVIQVNKLNDLSLSPPHHNGPKYHPSTISPPNLQESKCISQHDVTSINPAHEPINPAPISTNNTSSANKHDQVSLSKDNGATTTRPENATNKPWNCSLCTFENASNHSICVVCERGTQPHSTQVTAGSASKVEEKTNVVIPDLVQSASKSEAIELMNKLISDAISANKDKYPLLLSTVLKFECMHYVHDI